jgi:myotubularin-related protein 6/7/8
VLTCQYSPTYPAVLVVPSAISDSVLKYGAKYRSRARIPALTYLHPVNNCSITRSSQPMRGAKGTRNPQDERLVAAICSTNKNTTTLTIQSAPTTPQNRSTTDLPISLKKEESAVTDVGYGSASDNSFADVELLEDEAIRKANELKDAHESKGYQDPEKAELKVYGAQQNNLIVDARPTINALAMQVAGKGSENMDHYRCATKAYLGIDNIHAMRDSLDAVINVLKDSDISSLPLNHDQLARSGWVKHIANMMDGAGLIARTIGINHSHVLIHCSDGWDRTSQLSALSQLCLDPYFRTIDGFITLVEKDWLSFGHMFRHRAGPLSSEKWFEIENERVSSQVAENGAPVPSTGGNTFENALSKASGFFRKGDTNKESSESDTEPHALDPSTAKQPLTHKSITDEKLVTKTNEVSPMFHQFLDGTYQLLYQHPTRFEFNERFLKRLLYHLYSCQYGTFLFDNEKERLDAKAKDRTHSVWNYFLSRRHEFTNPSYDPVIDDHVPGKERLIFPKKEDVRWWAEGFGRKDAEMNGVAGPQLTVQEIDAPVLTGLETAENTFPVGGNGGTVSSRPTSRVEQGTNVLTNSLAALGIGGSSSRGSPSPSRPRTPGTASTRNRSPGANAGAASGDKSPTPAPLFEQMEEMK